MNSHLARVPFGQERRLNLGFDKSCPVCGIQRGLVHEYGCLAEECPKCGSPVVGCACECLAPWEEFKIVRALEGTFCCLDDAFQAGAGAGNRKTEAMSPTDKAAVMYVTKNVSPEMRAEINKGFDALFPTLKPCGENKQGERMYLSDDIADALGMDRSEVKEFCANIEEEAMQSEPVHPHDGAGHC